MYEIFDRLVKKKGCTVKDVSVATGIPQSTFTDWKKGRISSMKAENMKAIADFFKVSIDYLMTGRESYNRVVDKDSAVNTLIAEYLKKDDEQTDRVMHYAKMIYSLSDNDRQMVEGMIERLANGNEKEHED